MSLVWAGQRIEVPCLTTRSFLDTDDEPHPPQTPNCDTIARGGKGEFEPSFVQPITGAVWHTVHGTATGQVITGPRCDNEHRAMAVAIDFSLPTRQAATACIIAGNGVVLNLLDLLWSRGWGQGAWNAFTVGTELDQPDYANICAATIRSCVILAWWYCAAFSIQPMFPSDADGVDLGDIPALQGNLARNFRGHYFHANQAVRGAGDPSRAVADALRASGFEGFDVRAGQDRDVWRARQAWLGMPPAQQDGIAGLATIEAMREKLGRSTWVVRRWVPGDPCAPAPANFVGKKARGRSSIMPWLLAGGAALWASRKGRRQG